MDSRKFFMTNQEFQTFALHGSSWRISRNENTSLHGTTVPLGVVFIAESYFGSQKKNCVQGFEYFFSVRSTSAWFEISQDADFTEDDARPMPFRLLFFWVHNKLFLSVQKS